VALLNRRRFLQLLAAGGAGITLPSCAFNETPRHFTIPGRFAEHSASIGHQIWKTYDPAAFPTPDTLYDAVVIGGGIAGLSAAWKLKKAGIQRLLVLEMADNLGGTSQIGKGPNGVFPWGAHYINIPPAEADCIHEVLGDLGIIQGYDAANRPFVAPEHLLKWPHERLYMDGRWIEGLDPWAVGGIDNEPWKAFADDMVRWAQYRGQDGRRAFAIPLRYSTSDTQVRELDRISFKDYIRTKNWNTPQLDWLLNYACRDDYGSHMGQVSAWAGIHYFSCRFYDYRLNQTYPTDTLTWPQGNGFIVEGLSKGLAPEERKPRCLVLKIDQAKNHYSIGYADTRSGELAQIKARTVVYAAKLHTAPYLIAGLSDHQRQAFQALSYSPWLVAAIHLNKAVSAEFAHWDNVFYDSPSLGYIVADHQLSTKGQAGRTFIYYLPFVEYIDQARKKLYQKDAAYWVDQIAADILRVHPELEEMIDAIELYRWGHAMVRPAPGVIWGDAAQQRQQPCGTIHFATCDTTGLPLFEEACYSGIRAAEGCLADLGVSFDSSIGTLQDV
jgi:predicted NAD/FAD-dependent oxidoreductase